MCDKLSSGAAARFMLYLSLLFLALAFPARADLQKGPCAITKQVGVAAQMRDGVVLLADVYRPTDGGSYPVILMRLPYNDRGSNVCLR